MSEVKASLELEIYSFGGVDSRARTLVGADVGSYSVKCVVLRRDEPVSYRFMNEYFYRIILMVKSLILLLRWMLFYRILQTSRISRPLFCIALPCVMPYVVAQTFAMPDVPVKELVQV